MTPVRVITFDMGGTLLHPEPSVGAIYSRVMATHGLHFSSAALDAAFARAWRDAVAHPRATIDAAAEKDWWRRLVEHVLVELDYRESHEAVFEELWDVFAQPESWRLTSHAVSTMQTLRARGYRLGVLSNWDDRLRPLLERLDLHGHFDHIVISAEVGMEKPDTRIFRHTESLFGEPASAFLHIGDSAHHDLSGAIDAGWRCLLLEHGADTRDHRIGHLDDLLARLPLSV